MTVKYLARSAEALIDSALADTRVVVVNGARQSGKSTVVKAVTKRRKHVLVRQLDRPSDLAAATADPEGFVAHPGLLVIDEVQRAPQLVLPIKARVDEDPRPGQYLLTGSARILGMKALPDALVGRAETIELWPLSQRELRGEGATAESAVDTLFGDATDFDGSGMTSRDDYLEVVLQGGFPEASKRAEPRRGRFFEAYVRDLIDRDVTELSEISRRTDLVRLVRLLAHRQATLFKREEVASTVAMPATTLERYLALLEQVFLVKRVPAWSSSATTRAVQMHKLLFVDSGIAAFLTGLTVRRLAREPERLGPALENFVISEIARHQTWANVRASLYHYRTRDGEEVDAVLEANDGRVIGIEVKVASTVSNDDFRHLRHLDQRIGGGLHLGLVMYTGNRVLPFGANFRAVPIDALWLARRSKRR